MCSSCAPDTVSLQPSGDLPASKDADKAGAQPDRLRRNAHFIQVKGFHQEELVRDLQLHCGYHGDICFQLLWRWSLPMCSMGLAGVRNRDNMAHFDDKKPLAVVYFAVDYLRNAKGDIHSGLISRLQNHTSQCDLFPRLQNSYCLFLRCSTLGAWE